MGHQTTTARPVERGWLDAVALAARLQGGEALPRWQTPSLADGEWATLEAEATYEQPTRRHQRDEVGWPLAGLVVTDHRILVDHPERGPVSLWHLDLENLQLTRTGTQWHLDLHPVGINPHVRLGGDSAALVALHVAHAVFPATWPRLAGLLPLIDAA